MKGWAQARLALGRVGSGEVTLVRTGDSPTFNVVLWGANRNAPLPSSCSLALFPAMLRICQEEPNLEDPPTYPRDLALTVKNASAKPFLLCLLRPLARLNLTSSLRRPPRNH